MTVLIRDRKKYKVGDIIEDGFLGRGVIVEKIRGNMYMVHWDTDPPIEFNMGYNPSLWWPVYTSRKDEENA